MRARIGMLVLAAVVSVPAWAQTYSRAEVTTYSDNTTKWVLGQVAKVTCVASSLPSPSNAACDGGTDSIESETTYDPTYAVPTQTKAFNKIQKTMEYDTASTVASGQRGTLHAVADGNSNTTTLSNWYRGIPRTIAFADSKSISATVDGNGWITSVKDENAYTTSYGYDAVGRLDTITYPTGDSTAWNNTTIAYAKTAVAEYGIPAGHWKRTESTGNGRKVTYLDAMWRPLVEEQYDNANAAGTRSLSVKRYDNMGHLAFQAYPVATLPNGYADTTLKGTDTYYDPLGRLTSVQQDSELGTLTTTTTYLSGFKTQVTNPRGYKTTTGYMVYDQPTTDWPVEIQSADLTTSEADTSIVRDPYGKPLSIARHDPGNTITETRGYAYNINQELCRSVEPETGATLMGYDLAGNLAWSAAGLPETTACNANGDTATILARKVVRGYDARNRLLNLGFPDGLGDTTTTYTPDGLVASLTAANGSNTVVTNYGYNRRRLLASEQMLWGSINWPVDYDYNANGHLSGQRWHGLNITYAPNALGQPTQVGTYASGATYYPNGALKSFSYGNGIVHTMTQNARQLPDTSTDAYGTTKFISDGYDYDPNGNVAAITDGATGTSQNGNRTMAYDPLDRLTSTVSPMFGTATYAYDTLDNLIRNKVTGGNQVRDWYYCYDEHWQLTNLKTGGCGGTTVVGLGYDAQGNLSNKNGTAYNFDYGNRLRSVGTSPASSYVYDGQGRRVRDVIGASKYSQYTFGGQLIQSSDLRTSIFSEYFYLQGSLVAIRERNTQTNVYTVKYQHTDALGSPVMVTDASRGILERREYEPYGQQMAPTPTDGPNYTGHVYDAATGLLYMQQRYYAPMVGRFLSTDPVTALSNPVGMFNRYDYAANNPYRFKDPDGRMICFPGDETCNKRMQDAEKRHIPVLQTGVTGKTKEKKMTRAQRAVDAAGSLLFGTAWNKNKKLNHPTKVPDGVAHRLTVVGAGSGIMVGAAPLVGASTPAAVVTLPEVAASMPAIPREAIYTGCILVACNGAVAEENAAAQAAELSDLTQRTEQTNAIEEAVEQGVAKFQEWYQAVFESGQ